MAPRPQGIVETATTDAHGEKLRLALYVDGDFKHRVVAQASRYR